MLVMPNKGDYFFGLDLIYQIPHPELVVACPELAEGGV